MAGACLLACCFRFSAVSAGYLVGFCALVQQRRPGLWGPAARGLAAVAGGYACVGGLLVFQAVLGAQSGGYASAAGLQPGGTTRATLRQLGLNVLDDIPWHSVVRLVVPDVLVGTLALLMLTRPVGRAGHHEEREQQRHCAVAPHLQVQCRLMIALLSLLAVPFLPCIFPKYTLCLILFTQSYA